MTASPMEHPSVELSVDHVLVPASIASLTARNATTPPADAIEKAIREYRLFAIRHMKENLTKAPLINDEAIRLSLETAWALFGPSFGRAVGPMVAQTYIKAFKNAHEGNVPISMIYQLADEHAGRMGKYYNDTSADAMVIGFNTYVNRKLPQKAALERVIDAYGMTPRQMSGFTSAIALQPQEIKSGIAQNLVRKIKQYIGASISQRLKIFTGQEEHNLEEQAKQMAWLWLSKEGRIPANAEKMWLTAKDEKVCTTCGPLHGRKVGLRDTFTLESGLTVYTPGAHVNCRCEVRLMIPPSQLQVVQKADFDERQHRRDRSGRFTFKPVTQAELRPDLRALEAASEREKRRQAKAQEISEMINRYLIESTPEAEEKDEGVSLARSVGMGVSLPKPVRLSGGVSLSSGVSMTPDDQKKVELESSTGIAMPGYQPQTSLSFVETFGEKLRPKRKKIKDQFRPTVKFKDSGGNPMTMFTVVDNDRGAERGDMIMITDKDKLRPAASDETLFSDEVLERARNQYEDNLDAVVASKLLPGGDASVSRPGGPDGKTIYADVPPEYVKAAAEAMVNRRAQWAHDETIQLSWYTANAELAYDEDDPMGWLTPTELGKMLEIDPEDLEVTVVALHEGYEDAFQESAPTRKGEEIWRAPGNYKIVDETVNPNHMLAGGFSEFNEIQVPIRMIEAEPDVDNEFWVQRDMTDEEVEEERRQG